MSMKTFQKNLVVWKSSEMVKERLRADSFQKNLVVWKSVLLIASTLTLSGFQKNLVVWKSRYNHGQWRSPIYVSEELSSMEIRDA